jgi:protein pelota
MQVGPREDQTERIRLTLTIVVTSVEYDGSSECRCKGTCCSENQHVPLGAFHTIVLEPNVDLTLTKDCWDMLDVKRLEEAAEPAATSDLAIVLVTEGLAHVCLVGKSSTSLRAKVRARCVKRLLLLHIASHYTKRCSNEAAGLQCSCHHLHELP